MLLALPYTSEGLALSSTLSVQPVNVRRSRRWNGRRSPYSSRNRQVPGRSRTPPDGCEEKLIRSHQTAARDQDHVKGKDLRTGTLRLTATPALLLRRSPGGQGSSSGKVATDIPYPLKLPHRYDWLGVEVSWVSHYGARPSCPPFSPLSWSIR
jgi:hypothetical protein